MKILFLANELLQVCGVSKHLYHLVDGLQKYYPNNEYFIMTGGGNAIQKFQALGVPVIVNENLKHETRSITGYIKGIKEVYSFVKKNEINIIHSHHHYAASIAKVVSKFKDVKTILTNHGLIPEIGILNHFSADHIIGVNEHILEYLIEDKGRKRDHISFIPCGFPNSEQKKRTNDKIRVIAGGRLTKEKGFNVYLDAVAMLPSEIRESAEFLLAGNGDEEHSLKELNKHTNAGVKFLGIVSNFQKYLLNTDIFVMPSLSMEEGFPTILIEAALSRNLIITSKFRGFNFVLNNENSLLFEVGNTDELTFLLKKTITNFQNYSNKIDSLFKEVNERFSIEKMVHSTNLVYNNLIG
jgi:glycosyltransferase involved in cell wall biosynthesis